MFEFDKIASNSQTRIRVSRASNWMCRDLASCSSRYALRSHIGDLASSAVSLSV